MVCVSHPNASAARQCTRCRRGWCPLCVKQINTRGKLLEVCPKCSGTLQDPVAADVERPAFELSDLLARPFSGDGLITAAALASPMFFANLLGGIPGFDWFVSLMSLIYYGSLVGYFFQIAAYVGDGGSGLPGASDLLGDVPSLLKMSARGWICSLVGLAPFLVWFYVVRDPDAHINVPLGALTLAVGLAYMPAVLVAVVLTGSTLGALYPVAWFQIIARAPGSYVKLVGLFALGAVAFVVAHFVTRALAVVPIVGVYIATVATVLLWMAQAALVGGFLRRHAEDFGYARS